MQPIFKKKHLIDLCKNFIIKVFLEIKMIQFFKEIIIQLLEKIYGINQVCLHAYKKEEINLEKEDKANIHI